MIVGYCYPNLMKEFEVKNGNNTHGLLSFSYMLFVWKDVINIMLNICASIDKTGMVFNDEMLEPQPVVVATLSYTLCHTLCLTFVRLKKKIPATAILWYAFLLSSYCPYYGLGFPATPCLFQEI